jgi:hypothetical protein
MRTFLRAVRAHLARVAATDPVQTRIDLSVSDDYDVDALVDWDGSYLGAVRIGDTTLVGTPQQLTRLTRQLVIAAELANAADELDTSRLGTLSMNGGEA